MKYLEVNTTSSADEYVELLFENDHHAYENASQTTKIFIETLLAISENYFRVNAKFTFNSLVEELTSKLKTHFDNEQTLKVTERELEMAVKAAFYNDYLTFEIAEKNPHIYQ